MNPEDKFEFVFRNLLENLFVDRMDQNEDIFVRFIRSFFPQGCDGLVASEAYRRCVVVRRKPLGTGLEQLEVSAPQLP